MTIRTTITSLGQRAEGIAEIEGQRVFVPLALPGEVVEIELEGDRATLVAIVEPSPHRVTPFCPYFGACGGCQTQHMDRPTYEAFKTGLWRQGFASAIGMIGAVAMMIVVVGLLRIFRPKG